MSVQAVSLPSARKSTWNLAALSAPRESESKNNTVFCYEECTIQTRINTDLHFKTESEFI